MNSKRYIDKIAIAIALWDLKLYQEVSFRYFRLSGSIIDHTVKGRLVQIFSANMPRDPDVVQKNLWFYFSGA